MAVHKTDVEHIQALVDRGTIAESVKHKAESVPVREILQFAAQIADGSYAASSPVGEFGPCTTACSGGENL